MKKYLLLLCIVWLISSCCSKLDDCKCPVLDLDFIFECFTEKELADFRIIKYDSATGKQVSIESIDFIRPRSGGAQYNINVDSDTKYDIKFENKHLAISRRFSDFKFSIVDDPKPCDDCKTKVRYKTCKRLGSINFMVNGKPAKDFRSSEGIDPSIFQGFNIKDCPQSSIK